MIKKAIGGCRAAVSGKPTFRVRRAKGVASGVNRAFGSCRGGILAMLCLG